jgi:hypothetical protein
VVAVIAGAILRDWLPRLLDQRLKERMVEIEAKVRSESEEESAWRTYSFEARRRLYETIGPLRFQLLLANRDLAGRVAAFHARRYDMKVGDYYVTSFTYRLIRPLAITELIERQITYADFSVDEQVLLLLRFKAAAKAMLSDSEVIFDDPGANWRAQKEHFFSGNIGALARAGLVESEGDSMRVLREEEFSAVIEQREMSGLALQMLSRLDLERTPRLWARLVGYGYAANWLLAQVGPGIGISPLPYPAVEMLRKVPSSHLREHAGAFPERCDQIIANAL